MGQELRSTWRQDFWGFPKGNRHPPGSGGGGRALRPYELTQWPRITGSSPRVTHDLVHHDYKRTKGKISSRKVLQLRELLTDDERRELFGRGAVKTQDTLRQRKKGTKGEYAPKRPRRLI